MPYEEFIDKRLRPQGSPMVSILKQGILSLNLKCYEVYPLKGYKFAILFYDKTNRKIGIKPLKEPTGNAHPIRERNNGKAYNITAISFLKHYEIPYLQSKAYPCSWNSKEGILEISLRED